MTFYGLLDLPWWGYVIVTLVTTHITMICVTVFLHRAQAHKALDLHPIVSHFFRFWLWLTTGMKTREWVGIHRSHHANCETENDPHSPVIEGIDVLLWEGADLYRHAKRDTEMMDKYGKGTPDDWVERNVYSCKSLRGKHGIILLGIINVLLFGAPGLIVWGIQLGWTPFFAAGVINGIGHWFGYRNFEPGNDASTNMFPWGILIAGEELHNNHHAYGTAAKLSVKWYEFDIGWMYITILSFFRLAKVRRLAPKTTVIKKDIVDLDTVKSVFSDRLKVLAAYGTSVIKPVFKQERDTTIDSNTHKALARGVCKLIIRDTFLVDEEGQAQIDKALLACTPLKIVCDYRAKLVAIWSQRTASNDELVVALEGWCKDAEATGISALQAFVPYVKGFHLVKASAQ
jgi:stearoyl-CoA desaturase (Delta-9 desaturase)